MAVFHQFYMLIFALICFSTIGRISSSGNTDSATIRAIESEVRRLKGTSENIFGELKKQKDSTVALQNEFKWLHNEFKAVKKSLSDIELMINQTVRNDTEFIREKITELNNFIFKIGKVEKPANGTANGTKTAAPVASTTTTTTKKFILF